MLYNWDTNKYKDGVTLNSGKEYRTPSMDEINEQINEDEDRMKP